MPETIIEFDGRTWSSMEEIWQPLRAGLSLAGRDGIIDSTFITRDEPDIVQIVWQPKGGSERLIRIPRGEFTPERIAQELMA